MEGSHKIGIISKSMQYKLEEIVKQVISKVFCDLQSHVIWLNSYNSIQKNFTGDITFILSLTKQLDCNLALSIPRGVASKMEILLDDGTTFLCNTKKGMEFLGRRIAAVLLHEHNLQFTIQDVIVNTGKCSVPIPRRIIPLLTKFGNLAIEIYNVKSEIVSK